MASTITLDSKINAIRNAARASLGAPLMDTCPTCTRAAHSPFRDYNESGKIVYGCVDAFHGPALVGVASEPARRHGRAESVTLREATLKRLQSL